MYSETWLHSLEQNKVFAQPLKHTKTPVEQVHWAGHSVDCFKSQNRHGHYCLGLSPPPPHLALSGTPHRQFWTLCKTVKQMMVLLNFSGLAFPSEVRFSKPKRGHANEQLGEPFCPFFHTIPPKVKFLQSRPEIWAVFGSEKGKRGRREIGFGGFA